MEDVAGARQEPGVTIGQGLGGTESLGLPAGGFEIDRVAGDGERSGAGAGAVQVSNASLSGVSSALSDPGGSGGRDGTGGTSTKADAEGSEGPAALNARTWKT